ncbi:head-tail connector protein [Dyella marensis]|uniref:Phage gp6-like head-tail connector protein n=1 Tax=Dyella marensis TaxID=500610 RepID=A0A1I2A1L3_9GAMM|nr:MULTISPECIES: head-tail connector protein [Dyella]SFE36600.1 Phage gp6-like head-tail connector protein [Dyella marensis]
MSIVSLDEARAHCRVDAGYPADQLQGYLDAAIHAAADYLNRDIFADSDALDAAMDAVPGAIGQASDAYEAARAAASGMTNAAAASAALSIAEQRWAIAQHLATRTRFGIVATPSIAAAIKLTLGHLFANRESVVSGVNAAAVELPLGVQYLLSPYRRVMMP